jgi:hypothetical protein
MGPVGWKPPVSLELPDGHPVPVREREVLGEVGGGSHLAEEEVVEGEPQAEENSGKGEDNSGGAGKEDERSQINMESDEMSQIKSEDNQKKTPMNRDIARAQAEKPGSITKGGKGPCPKTIYVNSPGTANSLIYCFHQYESGAFQWIAGRTGRRYMGRWISTSWGKALIFDENCRIPNDTDENHPAMQLTYELPWYLESRLPHLIEESQQSFFPESIRIAVFGDSTAEPMALGNETKNRTWGNANTQIFSNAKEMLAKSGIDPGPFKKPEIVQVLNETEKGRNMYDLLSYVDEVVKQSRGSKGNWLDLIILKAQIHFVNYCQQSMTPTKRLIVQTAIRDICQFIIFVRRCLANPESAVFQIMGPHPIYAHPSMKLLMDRDPDTMELLSEWDQQMCQGLQENGATPDKNIYYIGFQQMFDRVSPEKLISASCGIHMRRGTEGYLAYQSLAHFYLTQMPRGTPTSPPPPVSPKNPIREPVGSWANIAGKGGKSKSVDGSKPVNPENPEGPPSEQGGGGAIGGYKNAPSKPTLLADHIGEALKKQELTTLPKAELRGIANELIKVKCNELRLVQALRKAREEAQQEKKIQENRQMEARMKHTEEIVKQMSMETDREENVSNIGSDQGSDTIHTPSPTRSVANDIRRVFGKFKSEEEQQTEKANAFLRRNTGFTSNIPDDKNFVSFGNETSQGELSTPDRAHRAGGGKPGQNCPAKPRLPSISADMMAFDRAHSACGGKPGRNCPARPELPQMSSTEKQERVNGWIEVQSREDLKRKVREKRRDELLKDQGGVGKAGAQRVLALRGGPSKEQIEKVVAVTAMAGTSGTQEGQQSRPIPGLHLSPAEVRAAAQKRRKSSSAPGRKSSV